MRTIFNTFSAVAQLGFLVFLWERGWPSTSHAYAPGNNIIYETNDKSFVILKQGNKITLTHELELPYSLIIS